MAANSERGCVRQVVLPFGATTAVQYAAIVLLVAHALEVLVAFRSVRPYRGPIAVSVLLIVLFGFLHWLPLPRANALRSGNRAESRGRPLSCIKEACIADR